MNQWANTVLTDKGAALMAKLTQGNTLNITRAVSGAGFVIPAILAKQTAVADPMQALTFRPVAYPEIGKCAITVVLTNDELGTGYEATQIGIYATDPDDGEVLLFISQSADAQSGSIIPSAYEMPGFSSEWTFYLQYGQANSVNVTVDPSGSVSKQELDAAIQGITAESIGAAASEHGHDAADISGTLPISKGGTGSTSATAALTNLGAAKSVHKHAASDINSGTLSSDRLPVVPITKGGTGANNAATARANLGLTAETWTFTLEDGSEVTKAVYVG